MTGSVILAAVLSVVIGGLVLVLLGELYYLLCWRRRALANPRVNDVGQEILVPVDNGERAVAIDLDIAFVGYQPSTLHGDFVEKLFPVPIAIDPEADSIPLDSLLGPPRLLFTISEETKEDLECGILDAKRTDMESARKRRPSTESPEESPFITPPCSPPHSTPENSPSLTSALSPVKTIGKSSLHAQTSQDAESFSPSLESFNPPLDLCPPMAFGVELLSLSPKVTSKSCFSTSSSSPKSPLQAVLTPPMSPFRPFSPKSPLLKITSPKTPFLLPPSPPPAALSSLSSPASPFPASVAPQTPYYTPRLVARAKSPNWAKSTSPVFSPTVPPLSTPKSKVFRESFIPVPSSEAVVEGVQSR